MRSHDSLKRRGALARPNGEAPSSRGVAARKQKNARKKKCARMISSRSEKQATLEGGKEKRCANAKGKFQVPARANENKNMREDAGETRKRSFGWIKMGKANANKRGAARPREEKLCANFGFMCRSAKERTKTRGE